MCRKCSVCEDSSHHWLDHVPEFDDLDEVPDWQPGDPTHSCKHCEQLGVECEHCDGTGQAHGDEEHNCSFCHGEGVIPCDATTAN